MPADLISAGATAGKDYFAQQQIIFNANLRMSNTSVAKYSESQLYKYLDSELAEMHETIDLEEFIITRAEIKGIWRSYLNTRPEYFWVGYGFSHNYMNETILDIHPNYFLDYSEREFKIAELNAQIETILQSCKNNWSCTDRLLYFHDWLCEHVEYDEETVGGLKDVGWETTSSYGALCEGVAICGGYSKAFQALCKRIGIECYLTTSSEMNHTWNVLKLADSYLHVDVTFDDTESGPTLAHKYFLKSDEAMLNGNHSGWDFEQACDDTSLDKVVW